MSTIEQLKAQLTQALEATHVEIIDDSWKHAGHLEATPGLEATHLSMTVVSPKFEGVGILDQHRLVHEVLKEARERHLHALQLKTLSPTQWAHHPA
ncbi:BolA family protein [Vampirovibrio sp.]|uniref:BolA family protein n=1 Tax=Vampirovibrio sp. TaxID=2717857 RepID=UPI00359350E2